MKTKIKPFILRREKKEVLDSLPPKTEILIHCEMNEDQAKLYQTVLQAARSGLKTLSGAKERLHVLTSLLKLRQIAVHPGLLPEFQETNIESEKFKILKEKIVDLIDENHKVTIFTQFTKMLDILEKWLVKDCIPFERIDGSVASKSRMQAVDRFQSQDGAGVFLISLKAGGIGINLTAADYVIHLDPWWNPAIEAQATDRVHRMGQTQKVIVYKMITKGSIEEKIQVLQAHKKALFNQIIENDTQDAKEVDMDSLRKLLFS